MFKQLSRMLTHLFGGCGNLTESFDNITGVTVIITRTMKLQSEIESGAELRMLEKQVAALDAA